MLEQLDSTLPNGKNAQFTPGLNIILAIRTQAAATKDSRNAVGKTSFVTVLDFLLGGTAGTDSILRRPEISTADFALRFAAKSGSHVITRSGEAPTKATLDGDLLTVGQLNGLLGEELFDLQGSDDYGVTYRSLISYYLRKETAGAFAEAVRTVSRQSELATQRPLTYLFGLDLALIKSGAEIADSRKSLTALTRAVRDPIFNRTMGDSAGIDAEIATLQVRRSALEKQLSDFHVVEQYAEGRAEVDRLTREIRSRNDRAVLARQRISDIEVAMAAEDELQPDYSYLQGIFEQVGVVFPEAAEKRFEEVADFHASVVRNRRIYLESERQAAEQEETEARREIAALDDERAVIMRLLQQGGALETFQELQQSLGALEGRLAELEQRRATVESLREARTHLNRRAAEYEELVQADIAERRDQLAEISKTYAEFAFAIYGAQRAATLTIQPSPTGYAFKPTIAGDRSAGVRSMAIFCFDLTMAVTARKLGRGPDFLVHDSHLYDAVEARQVGSALSLASRVCEQHNLQYLVTINSDALEVAERAVPGLKYNQAMTLTDEYATGGFFGTRFS